MKKNNNTVTIIADASFCSESKAAGYGVWIATDNNGRHGFEGTLDKPFDNNVAEAMAIANSLWHGFSTGMLVKRDIILIQSDSLTAIRVLSKKQEPYCEQLKSVLKYVLGLVDRFGIVLRYKHVPGHTIGDNNRTKAQNHCDAAAKRQMQIQRAAMRGEICVPIQGHKKKPQSSNYLRSRRRFTNG